jgi:hypothetical protein
MRRVECNFKSPQGGQQWYTELREPEDNKNGGSALRSSSDSQNHDAVDWFATEILRDPDRLDDLKARFRKQMGRETPETPPRTIQDDVEDFWDNVPI